MLIPTLLHFGFSLRRYVESSKIVREVFVVIVVIYLVVAVVIATKLYDLIFFIGYSTQVMCATSSAVDTGGKLQNGLH